MKLDEKDLAFIQLHRPQRPMRIEMMTALSASGALRTCIGPSGSAWIEINCGAVTHTECDAGCICSGEQMRIEM
jgi:hypothetical protein